MKKLNLLFILLLLITFAVGPAAAATPTPSPADSKSITTTPSRKSAPTPTLTQQDTQIEKIKDLVASKVAQLKLVDKRGIVAKVKSATDTQITATNLNNKEVIIDVDELTKFDSSDNSSFGISDIKAGDVLSIIGLYNKETQRLLARFVSSASNIPLNIEGVVIDKDAANFNLTMASETGKKLTASVESSTKTIVYENGDTAKSGFSKIASGERIIVIGFMDKKIPDQINAERIVRLPSLTISQELKKIMDSVGSQTEILAPTTGKSKSAK